MKRCTRAESHWLQIYLEEKMSTEDVNRLGVGEGAVDDGWYLATMPNSSLTNRPESLRTTFIASAVLSSRLKDQHSSPVEHMNMLGSNEY